MSNTNETVTLTTEEQAVVNTIKEGVTQEGSSGSFVVGKENTNTVLDSVGITPEVLKSWTEGIDKLLTGGTVALGEKTKEVFGDKQDRPATRLEMKFGRNSLVFTHTPVVEYRNLQTGEMVTKHNVSGAKFATRATKGTGRLANARAFVTGMFSE